MTTHRGEDITTSIKMDISDLRANIQEANRYIKLANSEFKELSATSEDWASSTDNLSKRIGQLTTILNAQKIKLAQLQIEYEQTVKEQGENSKAAIDLKTKINNQSAAVTNAQKELDKYKRRLEDVTAESSRAKTASEKLNDKINDQEKELNALKLKYKDVILAQGQGSQEAKELANKIKELSGKLADNKKQMSAVGKAADDLDKSLIDTRDTTKAVSDGFTVLKGALANLITDGICKGLRLISDFGKQTLEAGTNFEKGMSEVGAISGATANQMKKLEEKAREMGESTKFSASESAEAMKYMAMAGWKTEDMLVGLAGVMDLAAASGEDLGTVSDIVTDGLTAMGLSAKDSAHFADVLASVSSSANTNVSLMGESFKHAAALAGTMGYSIEDLGLALGIMANAGIKGEKAGTALKNAISNLAKPTDAMAKVMDEFNLSLVNTDGTMKPFNEVLGDLRRSFGNLSKDQQASAAATLFGKEAMAGMLSIINASETDWNKLSVAIGNADGSAKKMADTMVNNLAGDMTLLKSKIEGIQVTLYKKLQPSLRKIVKEFNKLLDDIDWDGVSDSVGDLMKVTMNLVKFLIKNIGTISTLVKGLGTAWLTYKTAQLAANTATATGNALQTVTQAVLAKTTAGTIAHKVATEGATMATKLLAAAQKLTPWGMIAGLIGGVAIGLVSLAKNTSNADKEQQKITETLSAEKEAWSDLQKAQEEQMASGVAEIDHVKNLKAELDTLVDANGKIKKGYETRANFIANTLADATGQEIDVVDGVIQKYGELSESIDLLIAKKRAKIIVDSQEEAYSEALTKKTEALTKMSQFEAEMLEAQKLRDEAYNAFREATTIEEQRRLQIQWSNLDSDYQKKKTNYDEQAALFQGYNDTIAQYEYDAKLLASGNAEDLATINNRIIESYDDKGEKVVLSLQEQIANEEAELDYLKQKYKETNNEMYKDQISAAETRKIELEKELEAQRSTVETKAPQITTAWEKLSQLTLDAVSSKTPSFKKEADSQVNNIEQGVNEGVPRVTKSYKKLVDDSVRAVKDKYTDFKDAGSYVTGGIKNGIDSGVASVVRSMASLAGSMVDNFKKNLQIHSPSKIFTNLAEFIPDGVRKGIQKNTKTAVNAVRTMVNNVALEGQKLTDAIPIDEIKTSLSSSVSGLKTHTNSKIVNDDMQKQNIGDVNFHQTIVSPKPLSRLDIYRQTNNQLFSAKARLKNV